MKKIWYSTILGVLFISLLAGCSENLTKADKQHIKQHSSLNKQQVIDKTLEKMKQAKGFKFDYEQIIENVVKDKSNKSKSGSLQQKINAEYVSDQQYHAVIDAKRSSDGIVQKHSFEAYVKDNKAYTKTSEKNIWAVKPYDDPMKIIGTNFNFFKFVTQLELIKKNLKDVKYSENDTTYQAELNLTDSNEIKKLVSDLIAEANLTPDKIEGKSFEVTFTIDKRDLHIVTFEQKENLIATLPDKKVNFTLTRTLNWNGPVSSVTLPDEVKKAK